MGKLDENDATHADFDLDDLDAPTSSSAQDTPVGAVSVTTSDAFHRWEKQKKTPDVAAIMERLNKIALKHVDHIWDALVEEISRTPRYTKITKQDLIERLNADGYFVWKKENLPPPLFDERINEAVAIDGYFVGEMTKGQKRVRNEVIRWLDRTIDEFKADWKERALRNGGTALFLIPHNLEVSAYRLIHDIVEEENATSGQIIEKEPIRHMARMHILERLGAEKEEWAGDHSINAARQAIGEYIDESYRKCSNKARELYSYDVEPSSRLLLLETEFPFDDFERESFRRAKEAIHDARTSDSWSKLPATARRLILLEMLRDEGCEVINDERKQPKGIIFRRD